jgi:hypothetical protein
MKKYTLIILVFSLFSCGSRQVQKSETKEDIKTEIKEVAKAETQTQTNVNVISVTENDEIVIEPIDTIKPMVVNGKEYKNARIKHKKNKSNVIDKTIVKVDEKAVKTTEIKQETKKKESKKNTERKQSFWWLLWLLLLIPIYWLWKNKFKLFGL